MNRKRRVVLGLSLLPCAMLIAMASGYAALASSRRAATVANDDVMRCEDLAQRIMELRSRPAVAGATQLRIDDIAHLMEDAATQTGVSTTAITRVSPEQGRRLGDASDGMYVEYPTVVQLEDITIRQLIDCLHQLISKTPALNIRSIRILTPHAQTDTGDRWSAEVTIAYLVYAPPRTNGNSGGNHTGGAL